jgi:dihydroxy-acid dehydratase
MSGTAYGTVVLHVCPEAAVGGNLAAVHDGDLIALDVVARTIHLEVSQDELHRRLKSWQPPALTMKGGYQQLYRERVMQANTGADLDFLIGCRGDEIPRESH